MIRTQAEHEAYVKSERTADRAAVLFQICDAEGASWVVAQLARRYTVRGLLGAVLQQTLGVPYEHRDRLVESILNGAADALDQRADHC